MKNKPLLAMIPARIGSERLKYKNLALLDGKPLIAHTILAAKESKTFSEIILNSDDLVFKNIADRYDIGFYYRPKRLGSNETKVDDVVYDFLQNHPASLLAWVNPTSPLQTGEEIQAAMNFFIKEKLDSMVTVKKEQVHTIYQDRPINFSLEGLFSKTQDLDPVYPFVYSIVAWKTSTFLEAYQKKGHAFFCGKTGYFPVSKETGVIIKTQEDLKLAEAILQSKKTTQRSILYDSLIETINPNPACP